MLQAIENLLAYIENSARSKYYVVLVDYRKPFDRVNRQMLTHKLKNTKPKNHHINGVIADILTYNLVHIEDGVTS